MSTQTGYEMPRYRCHKEVQALKIDSVNLLHNGDAVIMPAAEGYPSFQVCAEWVNKHKPEAGGYYVVYADGYKSWSPGKAFEDGYSLIEPANDPVTHDARRENA